MSTLSVPNDNGNAELLAPPFHHHLLRAASWIPQRGQEVLVVPVVLGGQRSGLPMGEDQAKPAEDQHEVGLPHLSSLYRAQVVVEGMSMSGGVEGDNRAQRAGHTGGGDYRSFIIKPNRLAKRGTEKVGCVVAHMSCWGSSEVIGWSLCA